MSPFLFGCKFMLVNLLIYSILIKIGSSQYVLNIFITVIYICLDIVGKV